MCDLAGRRLSSARAQLTFAASPRYRRLHRRLPPDRGWHRVHRCDALTPAGTEIECGCVDWTARSVVTFCHHRFRLPFRTRSSRRTSGRGGARTRTDGRGASLMAEPLAKVLRFNRRRAETAAEMSEQCHVTGHPCLASGCSRATVQVSCTTRQPGSGHNRFGYRESIAPPPPLHRFAAFNSALSSASHSHRIQLLRRNTGTEARWRES